MAKITFKISVISVSFFLLASLVVFVKIILASEINNLPFLESYGPVLFENGLIDEQMLGSTITTIQGTDYLRDSRTVINNNFTNLNTDKLEHSDLLGGTGITYISGAISFDCSEVEGTGIDCSGEAITLDATGDWTGTLDTYEASALLSRANHTGTQSTTTITGTWDISQNTNLAVTATGLELSGDSIALASSYLIPLTASTTNWNTFYDTPSDRITDGTGLTWSTNTLNCDTASGSVQGCLSAVNFTTFNNKWDLSSTTIAVAYGGTGATSLTDGGILLGSGTGAITAMSVLADGAILIGDGATDPVALTAFTSSTGALKHEYGGIEANISAITTGGLIRGASAGVMELLALGTPGQVLGVTGGQLGYISTSTLLHDSDFTGTGLMVTTSSGSYTNRTLATTTNKVVILNADGVSGNPTFDIRAGSIANADLTNSTISGISLGSNLANLTATNGTLTFSGIYNGGTARTIGLNLGNANNWTALQDLQGNASTTALTVSGSVWLTNLGAAAGTFLAVDAAGLVIATTTPSSGTPGGSDTQLQYNNGGSFGGASVLTFNNTSLQTSIGSTTFTSLASLTVSATSSASTKIISLLDDTSDEVFYIADTGEVYAPNGSAAAPAYSFANNTNAGFWIGQPADTALTGGDEIVINRVGGTEEFVINNGGGLYAGGTGAGRWSLRGPGSGDVSFPAYRFGGDTDTGLYRSAANTLGFAVGGDEGLILATAGAAAVNELTITNALTGAGPTISATGGDTNIGILLSPKGTGSVGIGTSSPGTLLSVGDTAGINFTAATSTFSSTGGINLQSGCFAIDGICVGGGGGSGTVTSVAMTVPTGFSISGSPITDSGTLGLTFTAGYSLPTDAEQAVWDNKWDLASTTIAVAYGGTGAVTFGEGQVLLGSSTNAIATVSGYGTSGQFLTSNGNGEPPTWQSSSVNQSDNYSWTGEHTFSGETIGVGIVGEIIAYASSTVPAGFLAADGSTISSTTYANLFALLGYTYGGSPGGDFSLPDLRGRNILGYGATTDLTIDEMGETGGATTTVMTEAQMPSHSHNYTLSTGGGGNQASFSNNGPANSLVGTTGSTGDNQPHPNLDPFIVLQYIIKY